MVVFDELPLVSLLDADRAIDRHLYPNIAALARDSVELAEFSVGNPSLDEVFLALTGRAAESPESEDKP